MEVDPLLTVQHAIYSTHNICVLIEYVKRESKSYQREAYFEPDQQ